MQRVLTTVTLLGLLVATAAAFAITEHLKLEKSPIYGALVYAGATRPNRPTGSTLISPTCHCPTRKATVQIKLRRTGRATVIIDDADHHEVATIGPNVLLRGHTPQHFPWDGRNDAGSRVPDGVYYPSVELPHQTFQFRNRIVVDTKPPRVLSAAPLKPKAVLFVGPGRSVAIRYGFDGKAHALVYLGRRRIIVGRQSRPASKIKWNGRLEHRPLPAGRYVLSVGARDLAGNETPADQRKQVIVVLRYVEVTPGRTTVKAGRPFKVHVQTAARHYTWHLGKRHGERRGRTLRLRAPTTPGTYRLVVVANGHAKTAVVKVRGK